MKFVLSHKYENNELRRRLLETGYREIIENTVDAHNPINRN